VINQVDNSTTEENMEEKRHFREASTVSSLLVAENEVTESPSLRVVIRKRPLASSEVLKGERDIIQIGECGHVTVVDVKVKVDLTKYIQSTPFQFDDAFSELDSNESIYGDCLQNLIPRVIRDGMKVSCFTFGQTGSGKVFLSF
jgi:kinesin family member 2/24